MCNCHNYYLDGRHLPSCRHYVPAEVDIDLGGAQQQGQPDQEDAYWYEERLCGED